MNTKNLLFLALLGGVLSGCAGIFNPIGETRYDCNRKQDASSVFCRSFKSADLSTSGELPPSRFDEVVSVEMFDQLTGIAPVQRDNKKPHIAPLSSSGGALLPHQQSSPPAIDGAPVRQGPVVQRTWIKRYVDENDVLHENVRVYKEIVPTKWAGHERGTGTVAKNGRSAYPFVLEPASAKTTPLAPVRAGEMAPKPEFKQPGGTRSVESDLPSSETDGFFSSMPQ